MAGIVSVARRMSSLASRHHMCMDTPARACATAPFANITCMRMYSSQPGPEAMWSIGALFGELTGDKKKQSAQVATPPPPSPTPKAHVKFRVSAIIYEAGFLCLKDAEGYEEKGIDEVPTEQPKKSWWDVLHPAGDQVPAPAPVESGLKNSLNSVKAIYEQRKAARAREEAELSTIVIADSPMFQESPTPTDAADTPREPQASGPSPYGTSSPTLRMPGEASKQAMSSDIRNKYLGKLKAKEMRAMRRNKDLGSVVEMDVSGATRVVHNVRPGAQSLLRVMHERSLLQGVALTPGSEDLAELTRTLEYKFQHVLHDDGSTEADTAVWTERLVELMRAWKTEPRTVLVACKSTTFMEAAAAAGCLTLEQEEAHRERRGSRLNIRKPDFLVNEPLGVKEKVEDINGVSMRGSTSLTPPPEKVPGMYHR